MSTLTLRDGAASLGPWLRWHFSPLGRAARAFRRTRHDYYMYLAELLVDSRGKKTMVDIFRTDAMRYAGTPRGVLTSHWAMRHQEGADLLETWAGTIPEADLMVLGAAAAAGGSGAIEAALKDVARLAKRDNESKRQFAGTIFIGAFAVVLALSMVIGLPLFFVPLLKQSFFFVPLEMWGPLGQRMLSFAQIVQSCWPFFIAAVGGTVSVAVWALPRWTGPMRATLDRRFLPYRLYRDARAAEFIATLSSMVKRRGNVSVNLRDGLELVRARSTPWLAAHCTRMIAALDEHGDEGAAALNTGLFSNESVYYIVDMMEALGPDEGLQVAGLRLEKQIQASIDIAGKVLRVVLLLCGVAAIFAMSAWLTLIIGELKTATALVFTR